jgi:hypothetical protein
MHCRLIASLLMTTVSVAIHPEMHSLRKALPTCPDVQRLVTWVSVVGGGVIEGHLIALTGRACIISCLFLPVLMRPMKTWEVPCMVHRALTPSYHGG